MENKRVTIKDIANRLNVSYGIINRALNNKPGISDEMRDKILKTADELGYRINKVAQSMARATIVIGVVIPSYWTEYFSVLKDGMDNEFDRLLDYNVESKYYFISNSSSGRETVSAIKQCIKDEVNGIILCDIFPSGLDKIFTELHKKNIPIVGFGNVSTMNSSFLCSVQVDCYRSGCMAAEMLNFMLPDDSDTIIFVGNKDNLEHNSKIKGFTDIANTYNNMTVIGVYETHDDEDIAIHLLKKIINQNSKINGIYCATSNSNSICKFIEENSLDIKLICTDLNSQIAYYIKKGVVQCSVFHDLKAHGRTAVRVLYEYIAEHKKTDGTIYMTPILIIRSNLDAYLK